MDIKALEAAKGDFYVPAYSIKVDGKDLLKVFALAITSVELDLKLNAPGRFSFTVENAFDLETGEFMAFQSENRIELKELFEFGKPVEIAFGYGDASKLSVLLKGMITEISTSFSQGGVPGLTISGYDKLYLFTIGKYTKNWNNKRSSQVITNIAGGYGLESFIFQPEPEKTDPSKPRIDQNQQSDLIFLKDTLAKESGSVFYIRENTDSNNTVLHFGQRRNNRTEVIELSWGKGLLSFSPEANLTGQVTSVEVFGSSAERGEKFVGRASRGDESGRETGSESGAEVVTKALGNPTHLRVRAAVHTQEEADARARAILEERSQKFITGSGESIGLPEIMPDENLSLKGMGTTFSKTYYVNECTHKIDSNGYSTTFKVEETTL